MSDDADTSAGSLERPDDAGKGKAGLVALWLDAIALAGKEESDWRDCAADALAAYKGEVKDKARAQRRFNILFSNVETIAPAVYNSVPTPDVRRRFSDDDPVGRTAAQVLERALSSSVDGYGFDQIMRRSVKDTLITGRGVVRVRYEPTMADGALIYERVGCESVYWADFRRGPARTWESVPWVAFRHFLTREELERLNPKIGATIDLDARLQGVEDKDGQPPAQIFQRATVWEIWDRERRRVLFIAPAYRDAPLVDADDPLGLADFFPVPCPLYAIDTPDSLVPVEPYRLYKDLADELDRVTRRIASLTAALKWRGAYADPTLGDFLVKFEKLADGEFAPMDNPSAFQAGAGGLEKAFWMMPIEQAAGVLQQLYAAREQIKASIYEVTGISDIVRGASHASETATAQSIKSQWGSLRIQRMQAEVQRFARDLLRLKAEIIAEKFEPQSLMAASGIPVDEQVMALLRDDAMRTYRVDIETDSTIQADVARAQQNASGFVAGFGQFMQAVGPAVQAGALPVEVARAMLQSFARSFKLGRAVEDAIDTIGQSQPQAPGAPQADAQQQAQQQAQQEAAQQQAQQAQAEAQAEAQMKVQSEQMKAQASLQGEQVRAQVSLQAEQVRAQAMMQAEQMRIAAENQRHAAEMAMKRDIERERLAADMQSRQSREMDRMAGVPN